MRTEFFAFALNEWQYKRVSFTRHYAREQAEKAAYRRTGSYKGSDYTDLSPEVIDKVRLYGQEKQGKEKKEGYLYSADDLRLAEEHRVDGR